jgi:methylated-DNA-[protein]-cysteine S-methyltransferase
MYTAYCQSPLGNIEISATEEHITSVLFTETEKGGIIPIRETGSNDIIDNCMQQLYEYFAGTRKEFELPLLQPGTAFQQRVWEHLCKVPYGETLSYLAFTKSMGDEKAIRAVAAANGKNEIAIIVPCHRIIGSDNKLVGYAGDLWRKQWLLAHEAKFSPVKAGNLF